MRYRKLDSNGDIVFGHGANDYLVDSPACVAQAVLTALLLFEGEWFMDTKAGVPWNTKVLGTHTQNLYDTVLRSAALNVEGVTEIVSYSSSLNRVNRTLTVSMNLSTRFGATGTFAVTLPGGFGIGGFGTGGFGL